MSILPNCSMVWATMPLAWTSTPTLPVLLAASKPSLRKSSAKPLCHRGAFLVEAISLTLTLAPRQFQCVLPPEAGAGARYQRNHKSNLQLAMADLLPCYRAAETNAT
jgi:hypothetical protein